MSWKLQLVFGTCLLASNALGARVFAISNAAQPLAPWSEDVILRDLRDGRFEDVLGLDRWTDKVFACFDEVGSQRAWLNDVRLCWSDGTRALIVGRYGQKAKLVALDGSGETVHGSFDVVKFEQLVRQWPELRSLLVKHTLMKYEQDAFDFNRRHSADQDAGQLWQPEWMRTCWLIVDNHSKPGEGTVIRIAGFGVSVEVPPGQVKAALFPDETPYLPVQVPYHASSVSIQLDVYRASNLPARWTSKFPPPRGFDRVRVISVHSMDFHAGGNAASSGSTEASGRGSSKAATDGRPASVGVGWFRYGAPIAAVLLGLALSFTYLSYRWRRGV
jgi:hypothetical protein